MWLRNTHGDIKEFDSGTFHLVHLILYAHKYESRLNARCSMDWNSVPLAADRIHRLRCYRNF
jgi:hypothetical protein